MKGDGLVRAIVFEGGGEIRLVDDAPVPDPADGEVLVRCTHVGLCGSNVGPYRRLGVWAEGARPSEPGWTGHENVGVVERSRCDGVAEGTSVLAHPRSFDGFAEYVLSEGRHVTPLPVEAPDPGVFVVAQPMATVLRALSRTRPVVDERCAVVGLGPIGLIFVNLLSRFGASRVIAADLVPWRLEWARRMGATDTVDASREDVVRRVRELTDDEGVDLCVEATGRPEALTTASYLPRSQGRLYVFGVPDERVQEFPWLHATANETEVIMSRNGALATRFFGLAIDMLADGRTDVGVLARPRLPWGDAARAFAMYADPAEHEGSLKTVLEL